MAEADLGTTTPSEHPGSPVHGILNTGVITRDMGRTKRKQLPKPSFFDKNDAGDSHEALDDADDADDVASPSPSKMMVEESSPFPQAKPAGPATDLLGSMIDDGIDSEHDPSTVTKSGNRKQDRQLAGSNTKRKAEKKSKRERQLPKKTRSKAQVAFKESTAVANTKAKPSSSSPPEERDDDFSLPESDRADGLKPSSPKKRKLRSSTKKNELPKLQTRGDSDISKTSTPDKFGTVPNSKPVPSKKKRAHGNSRVTPNSPNLVIKKKFKSRRTDFPKSANATKDAQGILSAGVPDTLQATQLSSADYIEISSASPSEDFGDLNLEDLADEELALLQLPGDGSKNVAADEGDIDVDEEQLVLSDAVSADREEARANLSPPLEEGDSRDSTNIQHPRKSDAPGRSARLRAHITRHNGDLTSKSHMTSPRSQQHPILASLDVGKESSQHDNHIGSKGGSQPSQGLQCVQKQSPRPPLQDITSQRSDNENRPANAVIELPASKFTKSNGVLGAHLSISRGHLEHDSQAIKEKKREVEKAAWPSDSSRPTKRMRMALDETNSQQAPAVVIPDRDRLSIPSFTVIGKSSKEDPFVIGQSERSRLPTSFTQRLRSLGSEEADDSRNPSQPCAHRDMAKSNKLKPQQPKAQPRGIREVFSGNDIFDVEEPTPLSDEPNPQATSTTAMSYGENLWKDAIEPHNRSLGETMHNIVNSLLKHLKSKEAALDDVKNDYRENGSKILESIAASHAEERRGLSRQFVLQRDALVKVCQTASRDLHGATRALTEVDLEAIAKSVHRDRLGETLRTMLTQQR